MQTHWKSRKIKVNNKVKVKWKLRSHRNQRLWRFQRPRREAGHPVSQELLGTNPHPCQPRPCPYCHKAVKVPLASRQKVQHRRVPSQNNRLTCPFSAHKLQWDLICLTSSNNSSRHRTKAVTTCSTGSANGPFQTMGILGKPRRSRERNTNELYASCQATNYQPRIIQSSVFGWRTRVSDWDLPLQTRSEPMIRCSTSQPESRLVSFLLFLFKRE